jgi:hypothetical protein
MRYTKNPRIALRRVRELTDVEPASSRTAIRRLAYALDVLRRQGHGRSEIHHAVRWYGPIPWRGVSGWEREALEWGRVER